MAEPLWTSEEITRATGGVASENFSVSGVSIDTRSLEPGDLFVALAGARDGHTFVDQARQSGAVAALVTRAVAGPHVLVGDVFRALEDLGRAARSRPSTLTCAAVTGSVGKTSVTQAMSACLNRAGHGHASVKSYNNHIGVPLTLARMARDTRRAVFEVGMNHADEITPLSRMVRPDVAIITTVGPVHIENFSDGEIGVARAKAEIFNGMAPQGLAILNADNAWFKFLAKAAADRGQRIARFGASEGNEGRLIGLEPQGSGQVITADLHGRRLRFPIAQSGAHWGPNALAVLLACTELGVDEALILESLAGFGPLDGRGAEIEIETADGPCTLVDESYNANPVSMQAVIAALGVRKVAGRRILALTDMLELGADGDRLHEALAAQIADAGVDLVFCAGPLMASLWAAIPNEIKGGYATNSTELAAAVKQAVRAGDVVVVKGSNGSRASRIVDVLADRETH